MNIGKTLFAQLMDFLPWKTVSLRQICMNPAAVADTNSVGDVMA